VKVVFGKILVFVILIDLFYMSIGNFWVTQSEVHPPPELEITVETPADELVEMGETMLRTKGGCLLCHKVTEVGNSRGPDLRGVGGRASSRKPGMSAEKYLTESLTNPNAYIVDKFAAPDGSSIMPASDKPPADLNPTEFKAVIAYLQSLGGEVTVKITAEDVAAAAARKAVPSGPVSDHPGFALMTSQGCIACHDIKSENKLVGPPLTTVSKRLSSAKIRESIVDPSAVIAEGFQDVMQKDFGEKLTPEQLNDLVGYLAGESTGSILEEPLLHLIILMLLFNGGIGIALKMVSPAAGEAQAETTPGQGEPGAPWWIARGADPTTGLPNPSLSSRQTGQLIGAFLGTIALTYVLYLIFTVSF
jgi:mono/diheme cytochrome c family protein